MEGVRNGRRYEHASACNRRAIPNVSLVKEWCLLADARQSQATLYSVTIRYQYMWYCLLQLLAVLATPRCALLHVYPVAEFLTRFPDLKGCQLSPYAQLVYEVASRMACGPWRATFAAEMLLLPPPFLCSRPFDNASMTMSDINVHRNAYTLPDGSLASLAPGGKDNAASYYKCRTQMPAVIEAFLNETPSQGRVLLFDDQQTGDATDLAMRRMLARAAVHHQTVRVGWAQFNLDETTREHVEAMYPHTRLYSLPHISTVHAAALSTITTRAKLPRKHFYFTSFVGRLSKHAVRQEMANLTAKARTMQLRTAIIDSSSRKASEGGVDLTVSVLRRTRFPLVLPGDHMHSTRLGEAVCAGGVPVLVRAANGVVQRANGMRHSGQHTLVPLAHYCRQVDYQEGGECLWRPPHEESIPFSTYGLVVDNTTCLLPRLLSLTPHDFKRLQMAAYDVCQTHYRSTALMIARTIDYFLAWRPT